MRRISIRPRPLFWSAASLGLFDGHMGYEVEVKCVKEVLAKPGGAAFYMTYLKIICEGGATGPGAPHRSRR